MGDFQRNAFETVHDLHLSDEQGTPLGRIVVSAQVTRSESWAHLKSNAHVSELAGPHNRNIVSTRTGFSVTSYGLTGHVHAQAVARLVEELTTHHGLLEDAASQRVTAFEDPAFESALRARLSKLGITVTCR